MSPPNITETWVMGCKIATAKIINDCDLVSMIKCLKYRSI